MGHLLCWGRFCPPFERRALPIRLATVGGGSHGNVRTNESLQSRIIVTYALGAANPLSSGKTTFGPPWETLHCLNVLDNE